MSTFLGIHTFFKADRSNLWGKVSESLSLRSEICPETAVDLFSEWVSEILVQVYGRGGGKDGS